jgi:signal transduction histidine kinase
VPIQSCQECLTNIHRHSGSATALVRLSRSSSHIELEIKDHGQGLPEEIRSKIASGVSAGVGFRGMQERVSQVGGALMVQSNGNGTCVLVELPIAEEAVTKDLGRMNIMWRRGCPSVSFTLNSKKHF